MAVNFIQSFETKIKINSGQKKDNFEVELAANLRFIVEYPMQYFMYFTENRLLDVPGGRLR